MSTTPFAMKDDGTPVTCYPVTFDGRRVTVYGHDGPRTRTRRNRGGYATAAVLRAMGYRDLCALMGRAGDDVTYFATAA